MRIITELTCSRCQSPLTGPHIEDAQGRRHCGPCVDAALALLWADPAIDPPTPLTDALEAFSSGVPLASPPVSSEAAGVDPPEAAKTCPRCAKTKAATEAFFPVIKNRWGSSLSRYCHDCAKPRGGNMRRPVAPVTEFALPEPAPIDVEVIEREEEPEEDRAAAIHRQTEEIAAFNSENRQRARSLREQLGLTVEDVAFRASLPTTDLMDWEAGEDALPEGAERRLLTTLEDLAARPLVRQLNEQDLASSQNGNGFHPLRNAKVG